MGYHIPTGMPSAFPSGYMFISWQDAVWDDWLCTRREQTGVHGSSENILVAPYSLQGKMSSLSHTGETACHNPSYTCVNLIALFLWKLNVERAIPSDRSFWERTWADFGTESKYQWLEHCCVFQNPVASQGKRNKGICDVWWVRLLSPGMPVSLPNYTDTIAKILGKPGKVCCGCPDRLGDKSFIYLTWLVGKGRTSLPCF